MIFGKFGRVAARSAKKTAGLFLFKLPSSMLDVQGAKDRHQFTMDIIRSLRGVKCPSCDKGMMFREKPVDGAAPEETSDTESGTLFLWRCHQCSRIMEAGPRTSDLLAVIQDETAERKRTESLNLSAVARAEIIMRWRDSSRFWYGVAAAWFGFCGAWIIWNQSTNMMSFWFIGTMYCFLMGMKCAYRHWQARTGTIFVRGAFKQWLMKESWFV